ncbi:hypothetical protein LTR56_017855 [Elasticomyces elasticus]|nr:hypothetical protein LTR22_023623 [Elasticomyces elasticus]KAK3629736.1 hypothetical protein LTR56_017855 [Elasticomyces elasticus]KAK4906482.1 hypothetical protein LTR49_024371 [Elasticomyces elasticus]KAK5747280.1 hypothetical protein LTS12_022460 [Elasticomyces elasticus]
MFGSVVGLFGWMREEIDALAGFGGVIGDEGLEVVTKGTIRFIGFFCCGFEIANYGGCGIDEISRIRVDAAKETIELLKRGYVSQGDVLARIAAAGPSGRMVDAGTTTTDDLRVWPSIEVATSPVRPDGGDGLSEVCEFEERWMEMSSVPDEMEMSSVWSSGMEEDEEYGGEWEGGETLVEMPDEEAAEEEMEE